jgi:ferritin-like metal-binding protein YciE
MQLNTLEDVLMEQLMDLYSAESQLVTALAKMAAAAHSAELRDAFQTHLEETRGHVTRLDAALGELAATIPTERCTAMQGLIAEGDEIAAASGEPAALDAALIGAAQRVEHYEIAAYGTARALANELGYDKTASLLGETLDEESHADSVLSRIAEGGLLKSGVNRHAASR